MGHRGRFIVPGVAFAVECVQSLIIKLLSQEFLQNDHDYDPGNEYYRAPQDFHGYSDQGIRTAKACKSGVGSRLAGADIYRR